MNTHPARHRLLAGLPVSEHRLNLNGISTAVLTGGTGRPLVLLHGPGAYAAQWRGVIAELVSSHFVIAPDLPGHGESGVLDSRTVDSTILGWLEALIAQYDRAPVLVGHTLGGAIAARFASVHHDRLASLVLVDTLGLAPFQPDADFGSALQAFLASPGPETHDGLWRHCVFDLPAVSHRLGPVWDAIRQYNLDRTLAPGRLDSLERLMDAFGFPAIPAQDLERMDLPVTLIWGRGDRATSVAVAEHASRRYDWALHIVESAADDPALEQPEAFMRELRAALDQNFMPQAIAQRRAP